MADGWQGNFGSTPSRGSLRPTPIRDPFSFGGGGGTFRGIKPPKLAGLNGPGVKVRNPFVGKVTGHPAFPKTPLAATPKAAAPTTPTAPAAATPPPGYPSPYDAQYFIDLASATNAANQKINGYTSNIANGQTNLNSNLAQLQHNQQLTTTNDQNAENSRGGFAQGALGQTLGNVARQYLDAGSAAQNKYAQDSASWNSAIAGVKSGLSIETIALQLAAAARASNLGLTASPGASAAAPAGTPSSPAGPPMSAWTGANTPNKGFGTGPGGGGDVRAGGLRGGPGSDPGSGGGGGGSWHGGATPGGGGRRASANNEAAARDRAASSRRGRR